MECSVCFGKLLGPQMYGQVMSNMYICDADDSLPYPRHKKVCIVCVYTHHRTLLLEDKPLKCYDPACKHVFDLMSTNSVATCALSAAEYEDYRALQQKKLDARKEESVQMCVQAAAQDTLEIISYMAKHAKRCPACATRVTRVSGCDDMQCQNCGTLFQWPSATNEIDTLELKRRSARVMTRSMHRELVQ